MKILSYSLFGDEEFYRKGLLANIDLAEKLFPEYKVRVYACDKLPGEYLDRVASRRNVDLRLRTSAYKFNGLIWRMEPLNEDVELVLVRDVDTRLSSRDRWVADHFWNSDRHFHTVRDGPGCRNPMLGGSWGFARLGGTFELNIVAAWEKWICRAGHPRDGYLHDISFLSRYVYPLARKSLQVYTEHVIYEGEEHVTGISVPRNIIDGRIEMIGMYAEEDISIVDDSVTSSAHHLAGHSMNEYRREMIEAHKLVSGFPREASTLPNSDEELLTDLNVFDRRLEVLYPKYIVVTYPWAELLFILRIIAKYIFGNARVRAYVKCWIERKVFRKKIEGADIARLPFR